MHTMSEKAQEVTLTQEEINDRKEMYQRLLIIINELMRMVFPGSATTVVGGICKVHTNEIDTEQLIALGEAARENPDMQFTLRRSGTGITLLVQKKEKQEAAIAEI